MHSEEKVFEPSTDYLINYVNSGGEHRYSEGCLCQCEEFIHTVEMIKC